MFLYSVFDVLITKSIRSRAWFNDFFFHVIKVPVIEIITQGYYTAAVKHEQERLGTEIFNISSPYDIGSCACFVLEREPMQTSS